MQKVDTFKQMDTENEIKRVGKAEGAVFRLGE